MADGSGRLDLMPGEKISFEESFNLYDFEHVEGTKSWRFRLPKTPNNYRLTKWQGLTHLRKASKKYISVRVNVLGELWKTGQLRFLSEEDTYWNMYFAGDIGVFSSIIGERSIRDFTLTEVTSIPDIYAHAKAAAEGGPDTFAYTFAEVYVPNAQNDPLIPSFLNANSFNFSTGEWIGFVGPVGGGYAPLCPFPYVKNVLMEIANELGITIAGDLINDEEFGRLVFFNTQCLNTIVDDVPQGIPVNEIKVKNHVPDVPFSELLVGLSQLFNQIVEYDPISSVLFFTSRESLLNSAVESSLRYGTVSKVKSLYEEVRSYSLSYDFNQEDLDRIQHNGTISDLGGIVNEEAGTKLEIAFSTLPTLQWGDPYDENAASSLALNDDVPKQFLFFRGFKKYPMVTSPVIPEVPYVSSDLSYTPATGSTLDKYSLLWKGEGGLYEVWWARFLTALNLSSVAELELTLGLKDFKRLSAKQRIAFRESVCLIEEIKIDIKASIMRVRAQALRL